MIQAIPVHNREVMLRIELMATACKALSDLMRKGRPVMFSAQTLSFSAPSENHGKQNAVIEWSKRLNASTNPRQSGNMLAGKWSAMLRGGLPFHMIPSRDQTPTSLTQRTVHVKTPLFCETRLSKHKALMIMKGHYRIGFAKNVITIKA